MVGKKTIQRGGREHRRGYYQRVGDYWRGGTGLRYDGRDREHYWSSAFICWVMRRAGVLPSEFPSTRRHSEYIHHAIQNRLQRRQGAHRLRGRAPVPLLPMTLLPMKRTRP